MVIRTIMPLGPEDIAREQIDRMLVSAVINDER
jgi:hypothetical protein